MNFANLQTAAMSLYVSLSPPYASKVESDSSSESDNDNITVLKDRRRTTQSVIESQEKLLVALLKKHGPRVCIRRGRGGS